MSGNDQYDAAKLYEDAYKIKFAWEKWLPKELYRYHSLLCQEVNPPVELQLGIILPFISSLCGPTTRSIFMTRPSVINLFWVNIANSGVGKSQARLRLIREPLIYLLQHLDHQFQDFEVSKFTRAGKTQLEFHIK